MTAAGAADLRALEHHFHGVIRDRIAALTEAADLELPRLRPPLPTREDSAWLPVPGMFGGFHYWIEDRDGVPTRVSSSWSRVVEGSGMRHEVTAAGSRLVEEGFV